MKKLLMLLVLTLSLVATGATLAWAGDDIPRMEAADLLAKLDSPDVVIVDVRRSKDFDGSGKMIKNAVRKPYDDVASWADEVKGKTVVLYCA